MDLCRVIEQALDIIGKTMENHNIRVETTVCTQARVTTFSRELIQVLLNLLGNSKDAILSRKVERGCVRLEVREEEGAFLVTVCDNGGGIGPEHQKRIFEPYFTTKAENGTGLGLFMSRTIVEKHLGGRLDFTLTDEGTCFRIRLPRSMEGEQP